MIHTVSENSVIIGLENDFSINQHQTTTTYDNNDLECHQNLYVFIQVTWYLKSLATLLFVWKLVPTHKE